MPLEYKTSDINKCIACQKKKKNKTIANAHRNKTALERNTNQHQPDRSVLFDVSVLFYNVTIK